MWSCTQAAAPLQAAALVIRSSEQGTWTETCCHLMWQKTAGLLVWPLVVFKRDGEFVMLT